MNSTPLFFVLWIALFFSAQSLFANSDSAPDFEIAKCRTTAETKMRQHKQMIPKGSLAVLKEGTPITLSQILSDKMIHFKFPDGSISKAYQWMYNPINKVQNRNDKYLATSYGEDVIITLGQPEDELSEITIHYQGTKSQNYLTLKCQKQDRPPL